MRIAAVLLCLLLAACGRARAPGTTTLIYASPYSANHPFSVADAAWIRWVEAHSDGTLRIHPVWAGALLSSDQSMIELRHGVADIGLITPIYAKGGAQLIRAQTGFYGGASTFAEQVALYRCLSGRFPEFDRELSGLRVLAVQGGTLPGLILRERPVKQLEDLRGLRIRGPTEMLTLLKDLGADPVNMPMGEVYSALAKGVLDGVVAPVDTLKSLHFSEVAHYFTVMAVPRGAYPARAMNEERWRALSDHDRAVLDASTAIWEAALDAQTQAAVASGEAQGRRDGVTFSTIDPADQHRFDALYERDAGHGADALAEFGIDGRSVFDAARRITGSIPTTGAVDCP